MSTIRMGWETWLAWAPEAGIGTAAAATYLWEGDGADSLTLGYQRTEARPVSGYRAAQAQSVRNTHALPGGAFPAMPIWMDGSSLWLLNLLKNHFQGSTNEDGSVWSFKPATVQVAHSSFIGATLTKRTGIDGRAEQYIGAVCDELTLSGAMGGFASLAPTWKALRGTHHATAGTGSFAPSSNPYFTNADVTVTWQGESIYPTAWSITSRNGIPDRLGPGQLARYAYCLGDWTGEASLTVPRDDSEGTNYLTKYITPSVGTLIVTGTASSGTVAGGGVLSWKVTALLVPRPYDVPSQTGEVLDTITFDLCGDTGLAWVVQSDASAL